MSGKKGIGLIIRQKRLENKLTQSELAEKSGISRPTIARYEAGESSPSYTQLSALIQVLGPLDLTETFTSNADPIVVAGIMAVPLLDLRAHAGYFAQPNVAITKEAVADLPTVSIIKDTSTPKADLLAFIVAGDSMEPRWLDGDIVVCERTTLESISPNRYYNCYATRRLSAYCNDYCSKVATGVPTATSYLRA